MRQARRGATASRGPVGITADSAEGEQFQEDFGKVAQTIEEQMNERHEAEIQQHEQRWEQQKVQEFEEQPQIVPTDPGREI